MGWGTHPDTMCMAKAQREAAAAGEPYSLAWQKEFKAAYARAAGLAEGDTPSPALKRFLGHRDTLIRRAEQEQNQAAE